MADVSGTDRPSLTLEQRMREVSAGQLVDREFALRAAEDWLKDWRDYFYATHGGSEIRAAAVDLLEAFLVYDVRNERPGAAEGRE